MPTPDGAGWMLLGSVEPGGYACLDYPNAGMWGAATCGPETCTVLGGAVSTGQLCEFGGGWSPDGSEYLHFPVQLFVREYVIAGQGGGDPGTPPPALTWQDAAEASWLVFAVWAAAFSIRFVGRAIRPSDYSDRYADND